MTTLSGKNQKILSVIDTGQSLFMPDLIYLQMETITSCNQYAPGTGHI
jgi:hypothetical protein